MTDSKRRRLLQAALAAGGASLLGRAAAQSDRNLGVTPRAAPVASGSPANLLVAKRRALVIGNSDYGFSPLKNPANDAKAISDALRRTGFEVTTALDFRRDQMLAAIRAYSEALARDKAVGLFYFAGHGVQLAWRNYLLPTDAKVERMEQIQETCVDVNSVIDGIAKAANPMNVVILDACRENPFGSDFRVEQKGLSQLDAPPGTLLAFATSPGNVASDGAGANGLYTENLLKEIGTPEAKIEDVFKRVRLAVRRTSKGMQIPWESTSLEEDFWFIPPKELKRQAEADREREFKRQQEAWERVQEAERKRLAEAERERLKREEAARKEAETLAELRRREEAARDAAERERVRRQAQAQEEAARRAREEAARAERERAAAQRVLVEDYIRQYPSGFFAELAEFQLDRAAEQQGEQRIQVVSSAQNPYSQGSARTNTRYRVGDTYRFNVLEPGSKRLVRTFMNRVTEVTESEVRYNNGRGITDLLGNVILMPDGRQFTTNQVVPTEFVVGKRWTTRFTIRAPGDFAAVFLNDATLRILGKERITVPAGSFDCFVVHMYGSSFGAARGEAILNTKFWYAPDQCRRAIAQEDLRQARNNGNVIFSQRLELESFQQS